MKLKFACIPIFIAACVLLYMGTTMLFLVPGYPGESYLKSIFAGRFLYGVVPTIASVMLLFVVGWLWDRSNGSPDVVKAIGKSFCSAVGAILLFWIALIIWADLKHLQP
jgi:hypothetical protein